MESQQAPSDDLRNQARHYDVAPAEVAASFHRFVDLPVELQLDIWDHAFPDLARSPSVLCFNLTVCRNSKGLVACFNPDKHVASSTLAHGTLLAICRATRYRVLESVQTLTLVRFDESSGTSTTFRVPFDFEKSCFCIEGWERHGMDVASFRIIGMEFAKNIKRLAFVVWQDGLSFEGGRLLSADPLQEDLESLALLFQNATQVGGITSRMSVNRRLFTKRSFISLFSFQRWTQKEMVEGFLMTKSHEERVGLFRTAICVAFEGWIGRLAAAIRRRSALQRRRAARQHPEEH